MIRLEWLELMRERGTWWILGALLAATLLALAHGRADYRMQSEAVAAAHAEAQQHREEARAQAEALNRDPDADIPYWLDPRDIGGFSQFQLLTWATKPPRPLVVLNTGQSDLYPYYIRLNTDSREKGVGSYENHNPHHLLAGSFDVAFVVIFLVPLALIALGASVGARERERGMHALIGVAARSPYRVYLRRLALRAGLLWAVIAAVIVLASAFGVLPDAPWQEVVVFLALTGLYVAFWTAALAAVALRAATPSHASLRALAVWIALLIVVPAVANFAARQIEPVPARASFVQAMRDATDEINRERLRLLEDYFVDHPEFAPADGNLDRLPFTITRIVTVRELEERVAPVEARYQAALDAQQRLLGYFELFSPGLWLQGALNRLSGTDLERQRDYLRQVEAYHEELRAFFNPRMLALSNDPAYKVCVDCPGATRSLEHLDYPQYRYAEFRAPVLASAVQGGGLVAMLAASFLLLLGAGGPGRSRW